MLELFKKADIAMYESKNRNLPYVYFEDRYQDTILQNIGMEIEIEKALSDNEFVLYYQPIIEIETLMLESYECLIRWKHEKKGILSPGTFIPFAEKTGFSGRIDKKVRYLAFQKASKFYLSGEKISLGINVSPSEFRRENFIKEIKGLLALYPSDPSMINLEITESTFLEDLPAGRQVGSEKSINKIRILKEMGFMFSIDDFGTGYSSLSYLAKIPFDFLKIDISFTRIIETDPKTQAIVRSTPAIAKNLRFKTIFEGVETEGQLRLIKQMGGDYAQGYLFGKPLPPFDF